MKLSDFLDDTRQQLEHSLTATFQTSASIQLTEAVHYSLLEGGKRLRPALVRAGSELVEASEGHWLIPAQSVEMLHVYSLVHDDLPAMDDDDLRRGRPTNHKKFDEATAILVGDALQTEAFTLLAEAEVFSDNQSRKMMQILARSSGARGMVAGQAIDLASERKTLTLEELENLHALKTGALINAALLLGAHCSDSVETTTLNTLERYAHALGLAFQITDDILDVTGSTEALGKPQGSDAELEKSTYVKLLGLDGARAKATDQINLAKEALVSLKLDDAAILWQLCDYVLNRDH